MDRNKKTGTQPLVMKFGGTSVGSPAAIQQTANIIKKQYAKGDQLVVVISAMSGITDLLVACIQDAVTGNQEGFIGSIELIRKTPY